MVVGALSYVGAAALLGERAARRAAVDRADERGITTAPVTVEPLRRSGETDSPSVRLIDPASGEPTSSVRLIDPDSGEPPSSVPFRGRLDDEAAGPPVRHLRPVPTSSGGLPEGASVDGRAAGDGSGEEPVDPRPPDEEEEAHDPDPGGHR
jgi:hypothetical protein